MNPSSYVLAHKPYGVATHQVDPAKPGLIEWYEHKLGQKLFPCHRLDKETTGAVIFAKTEVACAELSQKFADREVKKKYLLVTDCTPPQSEWTHTSLITSDGKNYVSSSSNAPNSETHFRVVQKTATYTLIEACPVTGKTHQIRLHARDNGIPILGDSRYGGSSFPLLLLHCAELQAGELIHHSPPPSFYSNLSQLESPMTAQWTMSLYRRHALYPELMNAHDSCLRLIHDEGTPLRLDKVGATYHAGWWSDSPPSPSVLQDLEHWMATELKTNSWYLQSYDRQSGPGDNHFVDRSPKTWTGRENEITYEFSSERGGAPGLFLDQRNFRQWLQDKARDKDVLNLFAYTAGFSLNAARGGAQSIVTVDLSPKYIQWSKSNFDLNPFNGTFKFYDMDSQKYLQYAAKKGIQFDLVICDPPSFSRNKGEHFRIDKDFAPLIDLILQVLRPGGTLHFSTNFEQWNREQWAAKIADVFGDRCVITPEFSWQWDFEFWPEKAHLKAFHIVKK